MGKFNFDPGQSYQENVKLFIDHMSSTDADLAAILERNLASIPNMASDETRVRQNDRSKFNKAVALALDALVEEEMKKTATKL